MFHTQCPLWVLLWISELRLLYLNLLLCIHIVWRNGGDEDNDNCINWVSNYGISEIQVFWYVMLCHWVSSFRCFIGSYCLHCQGQVNREPWQWGNYDPLELLAKQHSFKSQKTWILSITTVRTPNSAGWLHRRCREVNLTPCAVSPILPVSCRSHIS